MSVRTFGILLLLALAPQGMAESKQKKADRAATDAKACEAGEGRSCSSLGERYEAGLLGDINDVAGVMTEAAKYYRKACAIYKQSSCPNAERVEGKLGKIEKLKAEKDTPAEKERHIKECEETLDRAKREDPKYALALVSSGCKILYSGMCAKAWDAVAAMSNDTRTTLLAYGCAEQYCAKFQADKLQACKGKAPANFPKGQASAAFKNLHTRILSVELGAERAQRLGEKFDAVWVVLFP